MVPLELAEPRMVAKTAPLTARTLVAPPAETLAELLQSLTTGTADVLSEDQQRVVRALLCLTGAELPVPGTCDLDFFAALDGFHRKLGHAGAAFDGVAIARLIAQAEVAVGARGWLAPLRGSWFDAVKAPRLLRQVSGVALLIRALRRR